MATILACRQSGHWPETGFEEMKNSAAESGDVDHKPTSISRQESAADTVGKHYAVRQDLSSLRRTASTSGCPVTRLGSQARCSPTDGFGVNVRITALRATTARRNSQAARHEWRVVLGANLISRHRAWDASCSCKLQCRPLGLSARQRPGRFENVFRRKPARQKCRR